MTNYSKNSDAKILFDIAKWQGIQSRNPPDSRIWGAASAELHKLFAVMAQRYPVTPEALAAEFSSVLREWLSPEEMAEVILRNARSVADGDTGVCASHDFCDANEAMMEAFARAGLNHYIEAILNDSGSPEEEAGSRLWNSAWGIAKSANFAALEVAR